MSKEYLKVKDLQENFIKCFNELLSKTDKNIIMVNITREMAQNMVNLYDKYSTINPSEALDCLEVIGCGREDNMKFREVFEKEYNTILKSLLKSQEQEKVLEILKPLCEVVETPVKKYRYLKMNGVVVYTFKNEEEFELLKRWIHYD